MGSLAPLTLYDMIAGGNELEREAARQREYLERTVDSLKRKLAKDSELHRTDNLRIMQVGPCGGDGGVGAGSSTLGTCCTPYCAHQLSAPLTHRRLTCLPCPTQENTALIKEINELRREIRSLRARAASSGPPPLGGAAASASYGGNGSLGAKSSMGRPGSPGGEVAEGLRKELEMQRWVLACFPLLLLMAWVGLWLY